MSAPKNITLIPHEGFSYTPIGRIVTWALSAGRIVVVITELVVILAFLSRFWLDRELTNLNERIKQQIAILTTYKTFEEEVKIAHAKLTEFEQIDGKSRDIPSFAKKILDSTPAQIAITQLTLDQNRFQITGISTTEDSVQTFANNLAAASIGEVELANLSLATNEAGGIRFTLVVNLGEK